LFAACENGKRESEKEAKQKRTPETLVCNTQLWEQEEEKDGGKYFKLNFDRYKLLSKFHCELKR
jgi:hypothetical protein